MSDAQIASQPGATWHHPATPPGHATLPRHPARSRAGSMRCPGHSKTAATYLTWPSRLRARVQVRSGGPELALELEKDGYAFLDMDEKAFKDLDAE